MKTRPYTFNTGNYLSKSKNVLNISGLNSGENLVYSPNNWYMGPDEDTGYVITSTYPDIVQKGLVLNFDASNQNSLKGEPTTNMLNDPTTFNNWTTAYSSILSDTFNNGVYSGKIAYIQANGAPSTAYIACQVFNNVADNDVITVSFYAKKVAGTGNTIFIDPDAYSSGGTGSQVSVSPAAAAVTVIDDGNWHRYSLTFTIVGPGAVSARLYFYHSGYRDIDYYVALPQLEKKSYATYFVNGTRGATYATGGGWLDLSFNNNHGELVNNPTFSSDNFGSVVFNGANNYISVSDNTSLKISNDKTLSCWCYFTSDLACGIVGKSSSSVGGMALGYGWDGNGFMGLCWNSANAPYIAKDARDYNKWINLTVVQSGTTRTLYVYDSVGLRSSSYVGGIHSWNNNVPLMIGNANNGSSLVPSGTKISDVKAYNKALTQSEILKNFNATKFKFYPMTTSGLVLNLDAGDNSSYSGSGTVWYDLTSYSNNVSLGTVTYNTANDGNMVFDGTNFINFYAPNLSTTATVEVWAKVSSLGSAMIFGWNLYDIYCYNGAIGYNTANSDVYGLTSTQVTNLNILNNWTHFVFEMRSDVPYTNNKIYINGQLQTLSQVMSSEAPGQRIFNSGNGRISGWLSGGHQIPMNLSSFRVYNRSLTQTEVTNNYINQKTRF